MQRLCQIELRCDMRQLRRSFTCWRRSAARDRRAAGKNKPDLAETIVREGVLGFILGFLFVAILDQGG